MEKLFEEIMMENLTNLVKETDIKPKEAQGVPKTRNPKRPTPKHIIIKMPKIKHKEKILKNSKRKAVSYLQGSTHKIAANFSKETMQNRRAWHKILDMVKNQDLQPRIFYPVKLSLRVEGQIKSFPDKNKLKEFITTKPVVRKC